MGYSDYLEVMPEDVVKKLNSEYKTQKVEILENKTDIVVESKIKRLYQLLNKSEAYFNCYKSNKIKISSGVNQKHKDIVKSLGCCDDYSMYDGYLVPRYLNMNRCYCDHYNCEMDILKILLFLSKQ